MKKQVLAIIIAAGVGGCAGPGGMGFGGAARSYRMCAANPALQGCEYGFLPEQAESDAHFSARMGAIGAYLNRPAPYINFQQQPRFGPQIWIPSRY